jgi:hypothetical protein
LVFVKTITQALATILELSDLRESFLQSTSLLKNLGTTLKKNPVQFGASIGLAPAVAILSLKLNKIIGNDFYDGDDHRHENPHHHAKGPKGQAQAQVLAKKQEMESVLGKSEITTSSPALYVGKENAEIHPIDYFELLNDFTQLIENLAAKCTLKAPKAIGDKFCKFKLT